MPRPILRQQFEAWRALDEAEKQKHVDDLELRFGDDFAAKAVEHLHDGTFDVAWLDEEARAELRVIAERLEDWP